jgi:DNA-binding MarR family transcriptional regulator
LVATGAVLFPSVTERTYDPVHNVGRALHDAAAQMERAVDRRAQEVGITGAQWVVLIRIGGGIGDMASELCRTLGYDSGAMTRMLDRLEKLGLVRRAPSAQDGRVMTVSLTGAGEALYPRLKPIAIDVLDAHLQGFTPEEAGQLMGFLERIIANGQSGTGISASGPGSRTDGAIRATAGDLA